MAPPSGSPPVAPPEPPVVRRRLDQVVGRMRLLYLLAGGFALLHGDHVRVDVVYIKLPRRAQIGMDIFTSTFFFIFAVALTGSCWRFFFDSLDMGEVTEETWQVQFYPVKGMMVLGGILLTLAGLSKLVKDILLFTRTAGGRIA